MTHEAVILAGGFGTRLRQVVADVPKPMAPIRGRPFLELQLEMLAGRGFHHVVLAVGYLSDRIISHFGQRFMGLDISYSAEEAPLGTGGAIQKALELCRKSHVFVFNGDTYLDLDCNAVDGLWDDGCHGVIIGRHVPDTSRYGTLSVRDSRVVGLAEKGSAGPGIINAGCYVFGRRQLSQVSRKPPFSIEQDYLAALLPKAPFHLFVYDGLFIDIGVPEDFARAQELLLKKSAER